MAQWVALRPIFEMCAGRKSYKGVGEVGRLGSDKRRQRNNFGTPWQESHRKLTGEGDWERASRSRNQREVVLQDGKS